MKKKSQETDESESKILDSPAFFNDRMRFSELEKKIFILADEFIQKHHVLDVHRLSILAARSLGDLATPASISQAIQGLISKKIFFEGGGLTRETVLANQTRKDVFDLICMHPGIHLAAIKNNIGKDGKTMIIYLKILEQFDLVRSNMIAGKKVYFESHESKDLDAFHHFIQDGEMVDILQAIVDNPDSSSEEIAEYLHDRISGRIVARKVQLLLDNKIISGKFKSSRLNSLKIQRKYTELVRHQCKNELREPIKILSSSKNSESIVVPSTNVDPVVMEITDITNHSKSDHESVVPSQPRKCTVHQAPIEGLSYVCPSCNSTFCMVCITNVLLPERQCMVCNSPLEIDQEVWKRIDKSVKVDIMSNDSLIHGDTVTILTPDIWKRLEELQLDQDVIEEIIDRLKGIPPADRLKYLNAYFADTDLHNDLE
ncbi:MAG TPA: hypothetical protein VKM55_13335 [Candidatus Lokiarchaeia archaeon]|nr:hypothetical protein [Candidatus Lokiarchaeia archaeon]